MQQITRLRWMQISTARLWLLIANVRTVALAPNVQKNS
jgi:hypothetical protein